jgi:hypothetical protein
MERTPVGFLEAYAFGAVRPGIQVLPFGKDVCILGWRLSETLMIHDSRK